MSNEDIRFSLALFSFGALLMCTWTFITDWRVKQVEKRLDNHMRRIEDLELEDDDADNKQKG